MAKAKFDIKSEAQRGLYASVGVADVRFVSVAPEAARIRRMPARVIAPASGWYTPRPT